jgi:hypothetical protein
MLQKRAGIKKHLVDLQTDALKKCDPAGIIRKLMIP